MSYLNTIREGLGNVWASLPALNVNFNAASVKASAVAAARFAAAPAIYAAQQVPSLASRVAPVTARLAATSAIVWAVALLTVAAFAFRNVIKDYFKPATQPTSGGEPAPNNDLAPAVDPQNSPVNQEGSVE